MCSLKDAAAAVIIRHLGECRVTEQGWDVVDNTAREHRGGVVISIVIRQVQLLAEADELWEVEIG